MGGISTIVESKYFVISFGAFVGLIIVWFAATMLQEMGVFTGYFVLAFLFIKDILCVIMGSSLMLAFITANTIKENDGADLQTTYMFDKRAKP